MVIKIRAYLTHTLINMKMKFFLSVALSLSVLLTSAFVLLNYERKIDTPYSIKFDTRSTSGTFTGLKGSVSFSPDDLPNSKITAEVDANTIETGNKTKNGHVKGEDWLNTAKFPLIKFTSSSFQKEAEGYSMKGNLELHGVTKEILIPFKYTESGNKGIFSGSFKINRSDYGVKGSGMKASFVGEEVEIMFEVPTTKQ